MRQFLCKGFFLIGCFLFAGTVFAGERLANLVKMLQPGVVGVGVFSPIDGNQATLEGSGFVIGNGKYIATNYHVVERELDTSKVQFRVVYSGKGKRSKLHKVKLVDFDPIFDLAILEVVEEHAYLDPVFTFASDELKRPGEDIAFIGFPIGSVLGLFPAVHKGIIAAVTPSSTPAKSSNQLTVSLIDRLQRAFNVYQLDATAFPGNSGSALFDANSGEVIGVINKVMVQGGKEYALSSPSGITYAIPVKHLRNLAARNNILLD